MEYNEFEKLSKLIHTYNKKDLKYNESMITEYENKYKINLPERYSITYLMLEAFNDFEYTNSIAYEMVRRTEEFNILSKVPYDERTDGHLKQITELGLSTQLKNFPEEKTYIPFIKEKRFFHEDWYSHTIDDINNGLMRLIIYYYDEDKIFTLSDKYNSYEKTDYLLIEDIMNNPSNYYIPCTFTDFIKTGDTNSYRMQKIEKNIPLRILDKNFLNTLEHSEIKYKSTNLMPFYSRPKLSFSHSDIVNIPVNLNLEDEEIIAYVLKAKEEYKKKVLTIKHPLELIGNEYKESEKEKSEKEFPEERQKRKKSVADAFYIYDLFQILEPYFKEKQKKLRNEKNEKIQIIEKNFKNTKKEREDNIKSLKDTYNSNIKQYSKDEIKSNVSIITNISLHKVERYYKYMKEYIDNKKYIELITGKTPTKKTPWKISVIFTENFF